MSDRFEQKLFLLAKKEEIKIPDTLNNRIESLLWELPDKKKAHKMNLRTAAVLAAALTMLLSLTVTASVGIYRGRMEAMNQAKLEEFFNNIYKNRIGADNYNRYYSDTEMERKKLLETAFKEKGLFPQGELTLIDEAADYRGRGVAYLANTGTFFFPEKEMSDEELLQIIDFIYKRDYSLQKMNEMIAAGEVEMSEVLDPVPEIVETDDAILESDAIWDPGQELTIPYTGDLPIEVMAAGKKDIYLGGWDAVHRMAIGSSNSEVFYDDFKINTRIACLYVDNTENVFIVGAEFEADTAKEDTEYSEYALPTHTMVLWKVDKDGNLLKEIRLNDISNEEVRWIHKIAVDEEGYIYLRGIGNYNTQLAVLDPEGNLVSMVNSGEEYHFTSLGGLGLGKDGKMYTMIYTQDYRKGIAAVNRENGSLGEAHMGIIPDEMIIPDIIIPGLESDFIFWGYSGTFTYSLGEESAINVRPAYEAPCSFEGVSCCALRDGRIVFAPSTEHVEEAYGAGYTRIMAVPGKTCFYYQSSLKD